MDVLAGFQLDHGEPAVAIDTEQVDNAALTGGELGDLAVERGRVDHGVERFDLRPHLRFEPRFRMAHINRIGTVDGMGMAHSGEFTGEAFGFGDMGFTASRMAVIETEEE